ncbi:MAG TPA: putative Ig domain-containing protein [Steroidobacteraceae bacterium]|nr:putative Ig domain-containing protein [Steroidobacteraceae bacterium]
MSAPATVNRPPTISGQVVETVRVGESYDWQPTAADPDGDKLTFSAVNLPPWASIDSTDGRIIGTPGESDVGIYESITITVADAALQSATTPFSITVLGEAGSGVASLRWETPPSKVDGSPLDDLAGYRILYGRNSDDLDKSVLISNATTTSYEFSTLSSGIWYFSVVAVSACGLEGPPTTIASKSI